MEAGLLKAYSLAALRSLTPGGHPQTILSESRGHLEVWGAAAGAAGRRAPC